MKKALIALALAAGLSGTAVADDYVIDTQGAHAFVQFRIKHLGYSWLIGQFNQFEGKFSYDEKAPEKASVQVEIDTGSLDSNHAERDKHLRGKDFLDVKQYPKATFVSTAYEPNGNGEGVLKGQLTLHGVTKDIAIAVKEIGAGADPWGGYRRGFEGTTTLTLKDYDINFDLGPASRQVELFLSVEGIRQ
ncbi:YceI family protein [Gallaecimonas sp. GXIMD4217]|uniref:YceI family protein n=1 Tax=Gallaecimonas sp. GXIMD4217 TaxID=3131927 RepID=UPI00311B23DA